MKALVLTVAVAALVIGAALLGLCAAGDAAYRDELGDEGE